MKHILEKCKLILDRHQLDFVIDMISLKLISDQFEKERIEIRNDFLVRGICEKEVDGLIEDPSYYKSKYVPKNARWNYLKMKKKQLSHCFQQALKELFLSFDKRWDICDDTVANIINIVDLCEFNVKIKSENTNDIDHLRSWIEENNIDAKKLLLYEIQSDVLNKN